MAKRYPLSRRKQGYASTTKVPIPTLSGGVSTQAESKRLSSEVSQMDNALVSLERSIEKRPGFDICLPSTFSNGFANKNSPTNDERLDLYNLEFPSNVVVGTFTVNTNKVTVMFQEAHSFNVKDTITFTNNVTNVSTKAVIESITDTTIVFTLTLTNDNTAVSCNISAATDYWFYWFNINIDNRFLLVINYRAAYVNDTIYDKLFYIYKLNSNNTWTNQTPSDQSSSIISVATRNYITYGNTSYKANTVLKATTIGSSIIIVNTKVKAGFTSADIDNPVTFGLNGVATETTDTIGRKIVYYTAARYILGSNSTWYPDTAASTSVTISPAVTASTKIGSTITLSSAITLPIIAPLPFSHDLVDATKYVNPSTKTKFRIVLDASNYIVVSNWQLGGKVYSIEKIVGTITTTNTCKVNAGYQLEVEDFIWADPLEPYLGQSVNDFSELRFPPDITDTSTTNSLVVNNYILDNRATVALQDLYSKSLGKIYYTAASYLNFGSGYYRIKSNNSRPYTEKIRTTDAFSIIDKNRMPQKISFDATNPTPWLAKPIEWTPRTTGTRYSNPGPSAFLTPDKESPRQVTINAISVFRDRLYLATEDVIFTTQSGDYENLWLDDPNNITATDPIDIRAASNTYSEITSLTPFNSYLFINTSGNMQYELKGSQNQITPLTAEISPTSFYSSSLFTEPQLMGSLIYFLDSSKLYLYFSNSTTNLAVAQELTLTCNNYLPAEQQCISVAPAQDSIIIVDKFNQHHIYFLTSRFAGEKNIQNSFYRYILNTNDDVLSTVVYTDTLYTVIRRPTTTRISNEITDSKTDSPTKAVNTSSVVWRYYLEKTILNIAPITTPRLDRLLRFKLTAFNSSYDLVLNQTTITIPYSFNYDDIKNLQLVTDSSWSNDLDGDRNYEVAEPIAYYIQQNYIDLIFTGRLVPAYRATNNLIVSYTSGANGITDKYVSIGLKYNMEVTLSKQFVRDQNNNIIDGIFNLRSLVLTHKDTGSYDISIQNKNRNPVISTFSPTIVGDTSSLLNLPNYENNGKFVTNILSFADDTTIKITSNYPTPVNIVNLEIKGKFIQKYSSLNS